MIYFDTDVLINYLVIQDVKKNQESVSLYKNASKNGLFFCSLLCLQETTFVLSRLNISPDIIENIVSHWLTTSSIGYTSAHYSRAMELAGKVGFGSINDCIHTAIAESFCTELYTYNRADFKKIRKFTDLKISIF